MEETSRHCCGEMWRNVLLHLLEALRAGDELRNPGSSLELPSFSYSCYNARYLQTTAKLTSPQCEPELEIQFSVLNQ